MTASFPTEKANSTSSAMDSVLQICANLDVNEISSVKAHKDELIKTVPVPVEGLITKGSLKHSSPVLMLPLYGFTQS